MSSGYCMYRVFLEDGKLVSSFLLFFLYLARLVIGDFSEWEGRLGVSVPTDVGQREEKVRNLSQSKITNDDRRE